MIDKDTVKNYLKSNIYNFKDIDFFVSSVTETNNTIQVEAVVHNFSQHYKVYAVINIDKYKAYVDKTNQDLWDNHIQYLDKII